MNETEIIRILLWVFVGAGTIFIHEAGHLAMFWTYGKKANMRIKWFGMEAGTVHDIFLLTPRQNLTIAMAGVFAGLIPVAMIDNDVFTWGYLIICSGDFVNSISLLETPKEYMRRPYWEYIDHLVKKSKESTKVST